MNLVQIQSQIMDNVGSDLAVSMPQLNRLVNRAVEHIVNVVEQTAQIYNMAATPATLSVVSGTLTYEVSTATGIRKIVQVERTDVSGGSISCTIIPWRRKNNRRRRYYWGDGGMGIKPAVYITRNSDGEWHLGFPVDPQASMSLDVYYLPRITELTASTAVPTEIPEQHHELIVLRATIMLLAQNRTDNRFWREMYAEQEGLMVADLERWNRTGPRVRQFFVSEK